MALTPALSQPIGQVVADGVYEVAFNTETTQPVGTNRASDTIEVECLSSSTSDAIAKVNDRIEIRLAPGQVKLFREFSGVKKLEFKGDGGDATVIWRPAVIG